MASPGPNNNDPPPTLSLGYVPPVIISNKVKAQVAKERNELNNKLMENYGRTIIGWNTLSKNEQKARYLQSVQNLSAASVSLFRGPASKGGRKRTRRAKRSHRTHRYRKH